MDFVNNSQPGLSGGCSSSSFSPDESESQDEYSSSPLLQLPLTMPHCSVIFFLSLSASLAPLPCAGVPVVVGARNTPNEHNIMYVMYAKYYCAQETGSIRRAGRSVGRSVAAAAPSRNHGTEAESGFVLFRILLIQHVQWPLVSWLPASKRASSHTSTRKQSPAPSSMLLSITSFDTPHTRF